MQESRIDCIIKKVQKSFMLICTKLVFFYFAKIFDALSLMNSEEDVKFVK